MLKPQGKRSSKEPNLALRKAREFRSMTQAQVAAELGVEEKTVSRWENGVSIPRPYARKKLGALLGKSEEDLGFALSQEAEQDQEAILEEEQPVLSEKRSHVPRQDCDSADLSTGLGRTAFPMKRGLLFGFLFGVALVLVATLMLLSSLGSPFLIPFPSPTPKIPTQSTLRQVQQDCLPDSKKAGYLKILTKQDGKEEVLCYEGTGSMSLSLGNVRNVEVGNTPAQWTYLDLAGKEHLTPMSGEPNLYWCPRNTRSYKGHPIRILTITISPQSPGQRCTNGEP